MPGSSEHLLRRYLTPFRAARIAHRFTDVVVLGSGVAGLSAALETAQDEGAEVLLVTKDTLEDGATRWAQGGVAAVLEPEQTGDSIESHIQDTLTTGEGLCDPLAVETVLREGVSRIRQLVSLGATFDRSADGKLHFTLEGGHSHPRILHRGDTTGQEIQRTLLAAAVARPNITPLPHTFVVDLLTDDGRAVGALLSNDSGELQAVWAKAVVIATGGCGRIYRETTNPKVSTGDGVAMAFRAGARLQDLEFVQFHPTTLYLAGADRHLITEAVRGEGGVLRDSSGAAFMSRFHPLADLAPRDTVSRAIATVMKERRENRVFLDLSAIAPDRIRARFPRILELMKGFGIDILKEPIPVRPSAHYAIGGIWTDLDGRTSIDGLLAAGEVSCTGLHGANRLASNSLLEGLVLGRRAGRVALGLARQRALPSIHSVEEAHDWAIIDPKPAPPGLDLPDLVTSLRSLIWLKVGLERSKAPLEEALAQIQSWVPYVLGSDFHDPASWTAQNMLTTACLITLFALRREESRGVHFRSEFPARNDARWARHLSLTREDLERF